MYEPTTDPNCFIVDKAPDTITYECGGDRWIVRGVCNQCGSCEVGSTEDREKELLWVGDPGTPGAVIDLTYGHRLDNPIRPEGPPDWPGCSLSGEYIWRQNGT